MIVQNKNYSDTWGKICRECKNRTRTCRNGRDCYLLRTFEDIAVQPFAHMHRLPMADLSYLDGIDDEE